MYFIVHIKYSFKKIENTSKKFNLKLSHKSVLVTSCDQLGQIP